MRVCACVSAAATQYNYSTIDGHLTIRLLLWVIVHIFDLRWALTLVFVENMLLTYFHPQ